MWDWKPNLPSKIDVIRPQLLSEPLRVGPDVNHGHRCGSLEMRNQFEQERRRGPALWHYGVAIFFITAERSVSSYASEVEPPVWLALAQGISQRFPQWGIPLALKREQSAQDGRGGFRRIGSPCV